MLKHIPAMIMNAPRSEHAIVIVVPQAELSRSMKLLHDEFFVQVDASLFAPCAGTTAVRAEESGALAATAATHGPRRLRLALELGR